MFPFGTKSVFKVNEGNISEERKSELLASLLASQTDKWSAWAEVECSRWKEREEKKPCREQGTLERTRKVLPSTLFLSLFGSLQNECNGTKRPRPVSPMTRMRTKKQKPKFSDGQNGPFN
jgi:hypothetical protein